MKISNKKKKRGLDQLVDILIRIWIKWVENDNLCRFSNSSYDVKRKAAERCEKLQNLRRRVILEIDFHFDNNL